MESKEDKKETPPKSFKTKFYKYLYDSTGIEKLFWLVVFLMIFGGLIVGGMLGIIGIYTGGDTNTDNSVVLIISFFIPTFLVVYSVLGFNKWLSSSKDFSKNRKKYTVITTIIYLLIVVIGELIG